MNQALYAHTNNKRKMKKKVLALLPKLQTHTQKKSSTEPQIIFSMLPF
jgi:hypothetical protein